MQLLKSLGFWAVKPGRLLRKKVALDIQPAVLHAELSRVVILLDITDFIE